VRSLRNIIFSTGSCCWPRQSSTASPVVAPDRSVHYGVVDNYNFSQGHMFKFDAKGNFLGSYPFRWDDTPGVYELTKRIPSSPRIIATGGAYCFYNNPVCAQAPPGPNYITPFDSKLKVEWQFKNTNTESCRRKPDGTRSCINNMRLASNGASICRLSMPTAMSTRIASSATYTCFLRATREPSPTPGGKPFLDLALGAAYTPLSIGPEGTIYTQNKGHFFAVGN
jgi:hypothetical protein